jgi:hypothetical protein
MHRYSFAAALAGTAQAVVLLLLVSANSLHAEDDPVEAFKEAMAGQDSTAKKQAIRGLSGDEKVVMPLLIAALGDRQVGDIAKSALRDRTGLKPATGDGGNPGYPGYPRSDTAGGWTEWYNAKITAEKAKQDLEKLQEQVKTLEEKTAEPVEEQAAAATGEEAPVEQVRSDLGKLDRLFFTDGSSKLCYILFKREDLDGKVTSVRIVHRDGAGEEQIDAAVITRIDEDVQ